MFSSKLKIAIFLILSIALFIVFNRSTLNQSPEPFPFISASETEVNNNKEPVSSVPLKSTTKTQSKTQLELTKQTLDNYENRLDKILNDCSSINTKEQSSIIEIKQKKIAEHFQASGTLENQLNAIIITGKIDDTNRTALFDYVAENPTDKIAYRLTLSECNKNSELSQCNHELFALSNLADKNNAALLLDIASILQKQNNEKEARFFIEKAAISNYYNAYFYDYTQRSQDIITSNSLLNFTESLVVSIGLSSALSSNISSLFEICKNHDENNYVLSDACFRVGILMEKQSDTIISKMFGVELQKNHFKRTNNQKSLEKVQSRIEAFHKKYRNELVFKGSLLMSVDEDLARLWLETGINLGEKSAFESLMKEVNLLLKNPDYNPCRNQTE